MKKVRKFLSVFLIICMVATFAPAAFADGEEAAEEPVVITITDNGSGTVSVEAEGAELSPPDGTAQGSLEGVYVQADNGVAESGALADTETFETITATFQESTNTIQATVNGDVGSYGASAYNSIDKDGSESVKEKLIINGDIQADQYCGVDANANNTGDGNAELETTVKGKTDVTSDGYATGINVNANRNYYNGNSEESAEYGKATVKVAIEKDVTAKGADIAVGISADAGENGTINVVTGSVTATATGRTDEEYSYSSADAVGITADSLSLNSESKSDISIKAGSVKAEAKKAAENGYASAYGISASANEYYFSNENEAVYGDASVHIIADSITATGENYATGFNVSAGEKGVVNGEISGAVSSNSKGGAKGVNASAYGKDAFVFIDIGKDVTASGTGNAMGVNADASKQGAVAAVEVNGIITATATAASGSSMYRPSATGISASSQNLSSGDEATTYVEAKSVKAEATMNGDHGYADATGISATANQYYPSYNQDGELEEVTYGEAVAAVAIDDSVTATATTNARGIDANAQENGAVEIEVGGLVTATTTSEYGSSIGAYARADGENAAITIAVDGIEASGGKKGYAAGVSAQAEDHSAVTIKVGESGIQATGGADNEYAYALSNVGAYLTVGGNSTIELDVAGDVTAKSGNGIALSSMVTSFGDESENNEDPGSIQVFVEGTVSGGKNSFYLDSADLTSEDVNLTVWKATLNEDGNVVGTNDYSETIEYYKEALENAKKEGASEEQIKRLEARLADYEEREENISKNADEIEKNILYIIKVGENGNNYDNLQFGNANQEEHGYYVARAYDEAEENYVSLKAVSGYKLLAVVHGENDETVQENIIVQDGEGNYKLLVPKGGGLWLEVKLEKIEESVEYVVFAQGTVTAKDGKSILTIYNNRTYTVDYPNGERETGSWKVSNGQITFTSTEKEVREPTVDSDGNASYTFRNDIEIVLSAATVQAIIAGRKF